MPRNMRWFASIASSWLLGVLLLLLVVPPNAVGQCYYTYEQLPDPPPGWYFLTQDMNELGHLAATLLSDGDAKRAAFWSTETGIYWVPKPPGIQYMEVGGLNDRDVICGSMSDGTRRYGFLWDRATGQITTIDLPEGAERVEMNAINNANHVAATLYFWEPPFVRAVSWYDGAFYTVGEDPDVDPLSGYAMNELGEVAGAAGSSQWGGGLEGIGPSIPTSGCCRSQPG